VRRLTCLDASHDAVGVAEDQFILKQPTTIAGVAAVLRFAGEHAAETGDEIWGSRHLFENNACDILDFNVAFFLTLADSLERIAAGRAIEPGNFRRCEEADEVNDEPEEIVAAKEPPKPWTPEEHLASYRRLIDHCTAKIAELEAAGVTGASHV